MIQLPSFRSCEWAWQQPWTKFLVIAVYQAESRPAVSKPFVTTVPMLRVAFADAASFRYRGFSALGQSPSAASLVIRLARLAGAARWCGCETMPESPARMTLPSTIAHYRMIESEQGKGRSAGNSHRVRSGLWNADGDRVGGLAIRSDDASGFFRVRL